MDQDKPYELTILMPCLNEAETLRTCIQKAQKYLADNQISGEVLIADNGSTDGSPQIAVETGARLVRVEQKGYGAALSGGVKAAYGKYVIMGDADDSYDFLSLSPFVEKLRAGFDLVMGNRFQGGIKAGAMPNLHRYLGNPVLSFLGRVFFNISISDFHCGLRGFNRQKIDDLNLRTTGMEFASEMIVQAALNRLSIAEVPTILYPDGRSRRPHLRTWRDGWRHLRFLLLYSPNWLFFFPGIVLMLLGALISAWLISGPKTFGSVTLDINTLLFASVGMLIGFESFIFSLFTKVYAVSQNLLPRDPFLENFFHYFSLEFGVILGLLLTFIGVIGSLAALFYWQSQSFGPLDPSISMRITIPGVVLIASGMQIVLSSFFLGILTINKR